MNHAAVVVVVALASCSWLPPDTPPQQPSPTDRELAELAHTWVIAEHVLSRRATLSDRDAQDMFGREIAITATTYKSPWHGSCDDASRVRRDRVFADVLAELDIPPDGRQRAIGFGFGDPITEYELTCGKNARVPTLTVFVSGNRAMSCFAGVCYLLTRR